MNEEILKETFSSFKLALANYCQQSLHPVFVNYSEKEAVKFNTFL
jgi:hypothetical protein